MYAPLPFTFRIFNAPAEGVLLGILQQRFGLEKKLE